MDNTIQVNPIKIEENEPIDTKIEVKDDKQPSMLDDFLEYITVVKHEILKQVNQPFMELLGYNSGRLLEKNLIDFIAPEGISGIEEYFSDKPKDKLTPIYETVILTKDHRKIPVKIFIKSMILNNIKIEMLLVRNL